MTETPDETEYLLSNPANAARLRDSIAQAREGWEPAIRSEFQLPEETP